MRVTVRYFGPAADDAGLAEESVEVPFAAALNALIELLSANHPDLARRRAYLRFAVNHEYAGEDALLGEGDEIAVIPPVAGG